MQVIGADRLAYLGDSVGDVPERRALLQFKSVAPRGRACRADLMAALVWLRWAR
jgi:hypothetical protein